jgi:hypothetical protein
VERQKRTEGYNEKHFTKLHYQSIVALIDVLNGIWEEGYELSKQEGIALRQLKEIKVNMEATYAERQAVVNGKPVLAEALEAAGL